MADYETTVKLPSKGIPYENIPEEIVIRAMSVKEEKKLFGSTGNRDVMGEILNDCIITKGVDPKEFILGDQLYVLVQLRILSYGEDYTIYGQCPDCDYEEEFKVSLDDMDAIELNPKQYEELTNIKLPRSGHEVRLRLITNKLRGEINNEVERKAKAIAKSNGKLDYDGMTWELNQAYQIVEVDGEKLQNKDRLKFYEGLPVMDTAYIRDRLSRINVGIDEEKEVVCSHCGTHYYSSITMGPEFFFPRFD